METIYIKINIAKTDVETEEIRDAGLFFENISDALDLDSSSIEEIDESNWVSTINEIKEKYSKS